MRKLSLILGVFILVSSNKALADECAGKVQRVLDWPEKCNGQIAFKVESTNGKWVCALSSVSSSMVLAAYASGKTIVARTDDEKAAGCSSLSHYHKPLYIYMHD